MKMLMVVLLAMLAFPVFVHECRPITPSFSAGTVASIAEFYEDTSASEREEAEHKRRVALLRLLEEELYLKYKYDGLKSLDTR